MDVKSQPPEMRGRQNSAGKRLRRARPAPWRGARGPPGAAPEQGLGLHRGKVFASLCRSEMETEIRI